VNLFLAQETSKGTANVQLFSFMLHIISVVSQVKKITKKDKKTRFVLKPKLLMNLLEKNGKVQVFIYLFIVFVLLFYLFIYCLFIYLFVCVCFNCFLVCLFIYFCLFFFF
jgi:hypothetical protein